ncbi:ABC transporter substrate-binding protein [Puniceibacterium sp. IMCC21224]|uniref:substrate-binding periplasmic protein n=1 Tax=Puniceibacterium sp. IMCC21224 TaxID=1618204 RepID=UPI0018CDBB38|nr:transporter substrate-binding domain-containing protein [Puniceibacterium sp. IMCC21224]
MARDLAGLATVVALLLLVTFLPPDTSLSELRKTGTLKVCVPTAYPPLVTGDAAAPGIDIELIRAIADRLELAVSLNENPAMGRDFNPRNWRLSRAACEIIAGGVVDTDLTRSFLETSPSYATTGWASLSPEPLTDGLSGRTVGVLTILSGLDRIGLSSYLRAQGVTARILPRPDALVAAIAAGEVSVGITEALLAASLAHPEGWTTRPLPPELTRYRLVFGLWKGDLTLKRAVDRAIADMAADGEIEAILKKYLGARRF